MAEQPVLGFAGLLRQLRAEARLTQEELAEAAGLSPRSVSDLERGINRTARKDTAVLLAGALGLAEPVVALFVAAARGRAPVVEVLAAMRAEAAAAAAGRLAPAGALAWSDCPYPGLVPFEERDARVFYGRGELVTQLVQRMAEQLAKPGILLVAGESGAGKSSLLRAGLMPRLAAGALGPESERWPRRVIRPTGSPLRRLAMLLADIAGADPVSMYRSLSATPDTASMLVEHAVRSAVGRAVPPRLILVIDQFEELFTAGEDTDASQAEREAFIAALHAAATVPVGRQRLPPALVVAAIRADFLGQAIAYPPLRAVMDAGLFTVGPMSEAELRLAMTGPAAEAGLAVEPALVEAVISELREGAAGGLGSGALPLMSQAMAATWERREGNKLTLRGYRRAGGVADAVNRGAQAAFDALTDRQRDAARLVFTQLTVVMPDGRFVRRRCGRADLGSPEAETTADIDAVIDAFSAQRLLVLGQDSVEISHDVLLHAWTQLRDWLGDDQLDRALYSQVVTDADTWDSNGRDPSYLYQPGRLATIDAATTRWRGAPTRYLPLPAASQAFLRAAHHAARRSTRRRRGVIAGLAALTVTAISAAGIAVNDAADASRQHAISLSRQLATESLIIASGDPLTARQLAVAAWRVSPTDQAASVMAQLLTEQQRDGILPGDPAHDGVTGAAFSPDDRLLATAYGDGTVRLWNPATEQAVGAPIRVATGTTTGVNAVAFSPNGKLLATADTDGTVQLWNTATEQAVGAPIRVATGTTTGVNAVAFSPNGKLLASADTDGTVRVWNPVGGQAPLATYTGNGPLSGVAFSPNGKLLAAVDTDGTIRVWNQASGQVPGAIYTVVGGVNAVAFSPNGELLASADADGTVRLWDTATGQQAGTALPADTGTGGGVNGVAFSPNGELLASADADGTVRLWDTATRTASGPPLRIETGPGPGVNAVAFSPNGKLLVSGDADGTVRLWNTATRQAPHAAIPADTGALYGVRAVAYSPNGELLASADADGTVRLWDTGTGLPAGHPLPAESGLVSGVKNEPFQLDVNGVAFSPNGELLASAGADGTVRLWYTATRQPTGTVLFVEAGVNGVAFSPNGQLVATADADGTVRLWNTATGQQVGAPLRADTGTGGGVNGVAFSPNGTLLASAGADGTVRLWNTATRQPTGTAFLVEGGVNGVAFSPDGTLLASAGADGTVRLWNTTTGQQVGTPLRVDTGYGVNGVAFSPDGTLLATADADGTVQTWQMSLFADPYRALCADVGPPTRADWTQYAPGDPQPSVCG
jgi:WD40 repeat protein/transcriptional regulator with XRE-family HTH domain